MIIKNKREIATTDLREKTLEIIESAVESILPKNLIGERLKYDSQNKVLFFDNKKYDISRGKSFRNWWRKSSWTDGRNIGRNYRRCYSRWNSQL
jgi:hypothetical protein